MSEYRRHSNPVYGTVEFWFNPDGVPSRYRVFGEFAIPATFRVRNILTGCVHEVKGIGIVDATMGHKNLRGTTHYHFLCPGIAGLRYYVLTTQDITCKRCLKMKGGDTSVKEDS